MRQNALRHRTHGGDAFTRAPRGRGLKRALIERGKPHGGVEQPRHQQEALLVVLETQRIGENGLGHGSLLRRLAD